jgi:GDSL-like Lipase/Acylhydrolase family
VSAAWLRRTGIGVAAVVVLSASPAVRASAETERAWLALGDSYSSGTGVAGNDGPPCRRATGEPVGSQPGGRAWAIKAFDSVRVDQDLTEIDFVACHGAVTDDATKQIREASRSGRTAWDVVTFSFGGNNVKFADVIKTCLGLRTDWSSMDPGCGFSEEGLRRRVDMLTGGERIDPVEMAGTVTLPRLYDNVAKVLKPGGDVVVAGYPHLFVDRTGVDQKESAKRHAKNSCSGIRNVDIDLLNAVAGYLNEQMRMAVLAADDKHRPDGKRFHFLDVTEVYAKDAPGHRHALCSGHSWLNGRSSPDWQDAFFNFFHPTQDGHDAIGRQLAGMFGSTIRFDDGPAGQPRTGGTTGPGNNGPPGGSRGPGGEKTPSGGSSPGDPALADLRIERVWTRNATGADQTTFSCGSQVRFSLSITNPNGNALQTNIAFLADNGSRSLYNYDETVNVPPGLANYESPLTLPADADGEFDYSVILAPERNLHRLQQSTTFRVTCSN